MSTFKAYFKKEIIESIRQYKYLIIAIGLIFFAVSDPIMLKMLPSILKGQSNIDISSIMKINGQTALQNYIKDLFQLGNIIVVFTLSGILGKEVSEGKLIFPYTKGCSPVGMVLAKIIHYIIAVTIVTFLGSMVNFYYVNVLFNGNTVSFMGVVYSALCISLFFDFNIILIAFFSSIFKKDIIAGIMVLFLSYFLLIFQSLKAVYAYLPSKLIDIANTFSLTGIEKPVITILIASAILIYITTKKMAAI